MNTLGDCVVACFKQINGDRFVVAKPKIQREWKYQQMVQHICNSSNSSALKPMPMASTAKMWIVEKAEHHK